MPWPVLLMARELDLGGSERQMALIAKALDRTTFTPIIGCFRPSGFRALELRNAGIPIAHFPVSSFASPRAPSAAWNLARFIRSRGIRLVHTFDYPLTVFAVPLTRLLTNAIAVSSQRSHRSLIPPPYRKLVRFTDRLASAIVVNCESVRRHLEDDERVSPPRIRLCYNGIDFDQFHPAQTAPALRKPRIAIGSASVLRPEKSLPDLIRAFAQLNHPSATLSILGSGPERNHLESLSRSLGISRRCSFEPATAGVAAWLRAIDIFVLPSRSEALSNSLMEAMACRCCALASNIGGNPELIRNGETGLLFEPGDVNSLTAALHRLIRDAPLRLRLAASGSRFIRENFSIRSSAARMAEIYAELIERRIRPPRP